MKRVYLDHNASAPLRREVAALLIERLAAGGAGNPSSVHAAGRAARRQLEEARERLAALLGCQRDQLVFTSGGTESNNLALTAGRHPAVSAASHPSALEPGRRNGATIVPVDSDGMPRLSPAHTPSLDLLSVTHAHHETGQVLDLAVLSEQTHKIGGLLHADSCQAFGRLPIDFASSGADLMSISAHKLGGPVGIGALVIGARAHLEPIVRGGQQELGLRPGTEPALLAEAFACAAECAERDRAQCETAWSRWRAQLVAAVRDAEPASIFLTPSAGSLTNTCCVSFPGRPGSSLVQRLDLLGIAVSHGSACASGSSVPSAALLALGHDEDVAASCVRISMGHDTTDDDVETFCSRLPEALASVSPRPLAGKTASPSEH